jgi:hypothetical protein
MATEKFVLDLTAFVNKAKGNFDQVVRKVILDVGTRLVLRSPVGQPALWKGPAPKGYTGGRFRANWQYGDSVRPRGVIDAVDLSGASSVARVASGAARTAAGRLHYLTNNLPYAMALERGHSKQAPAGMVGLVVREWQGIVDRAAQAVKNR